MSLTLAAPRTPPRWRPLARLKRAATASAALLTLLVAWFVTGQWELVNPFLVPPLGAVLDRLREDALSGDLLTNAGLTLGRSLAGFALACALGIPLGIAVARRPLLRWFCDPLISIGFPMPKIAFLPVFILWFGVYDTSKIVMTTFACIFAIIAAADAGMRGVDKFLIWSARSMGTSGFALFREVLLPAALPQIFTGLQIALPTALITTVAAEMLMGGAGLGGAMLQSGRFADSPGVYAGIIETALVGLIAVTAMTRLRRRLLRWHPEFNRR